jgi:hypothetical protein
MLLEKLSVAVRSRIYRLLGRDFRSELTRQYASRLGEPKVIDREGIRRLDIDYSNPMARDTYREIQQIGNKHKLGAVFAVEQNIAAMANYTVRRIGTVGLVLCHGTRNGAEQRWFKANLPGTPRVIGTEISDTASQFPDTIQWDFHQQNPDWVGRADVVYSNSWDHSIDPDRMFRNWMECLTAKGVMLVEHTIHHEGRNPDPLDPFGATRDGLVRLLERVGKPEFRVVEILNNLPNTSDGRCAIVVARS